jgi:hypothetical protein
LKSYKSLSTDQILAELIKAVGEMLYSWDTQTYWFCME